MDSSTMAGQSNSSSGDMLQNAETCVSSKVPLPDAGSESPSNTWFLGHTIFYIPNVVSIGSSVLAGLTSVTDTQLDQSHYSI